jgi:hypothetical protein
MPAERITDEFLRELFPPERADEFFEALYGGAETGAFDIALKSNGFNAATNTLMLEFRLTERPGKCMACNLTYGLPEVFKRHPVINVSGMMEEIEKALSPEWKVKQWQIGSTIALDPKVNTIPLMVELEPAG